MVCANALEPMMQPKKVGKAYAPTNFSNGSGNKASDRLQVSISMAAV
jgi:hypothetical protein